MIGAGSQNQDSGGGTLMVRWVLWRGVLKCRDESRVHPKCRDESGAHKPTRTRTGTKTGSTNIQDYKQRSDKGDERVVRIYRVVWWAAAGVDDCWLVDQRWCVGTPTHTLTHTHITMSKRRAGSMGLMNRDNKSLIYLDVAEHNTVPCWLHHPHTCLFCRQTEEDTARVQWCPSGGPAPVFQMTSWPQTLEPQACSHLVL